MKAFVTLNEWSVCNLNYFEYSWGMFGKHLLCFRWLASGAFGDPKRIKI